MIQKTHHYDDRARPSTLKTQIWRNAICTQKITISDECSYRRSFRLFSSLDSDSPQSPPEIK